MNDHEIKEIFEATKTIAVVGLSDNPSRPSHRVSAYMQRQGYRIIPVNPGIAEALGEKAYAGLKDIPEQVDMVDIFRQSEAVPPIVDDAIAIGAKTIWMQDGVMHEAAAQKARAAGIKVVMDDCVLRQHSRLIG